MAGFKPGDALLIRAPEPWDERWHFYIILNDPDQNEQSVLLMPVLETLRDYHRDRSCILHADDHPFIKHDSVINYRDSVVMGSAAAAALVASGKAKLRDPLREDVLRRVLEGARATPHLSAAQKALLPPVEESET